MKKSFVLVLVLCIAMVAGGCMTNIHVIGTGAKGGNVEQERQWYVLWGLIPINKIDSKEMAKGAKDYTIKSEQSALDVIMNIVTGFVTVYSRTIEVKH